MYQKKAICTIILAGANIIIFLFLSFGGMTEDPVYMLGKGAMYVPYVIGDKEFYRIITSTFLHFGFSHLINNMITLILLGWQLELEIGKIKYLIIYFASGIGGNILSAVNEMRTQDYTVSAGASGAIFGIIGALIYVAMRNHGRVGTVSGRGIIFMAALSLYYGFTSTGIDNFAHIGGLICGFVLAVLLYWKRNRKNSTPAY